MKNNSFRLLTERRGKKILSFLVVFMIFNLLPTLSFAQECLTGLTGNPVVARQGKLQTSAVVFRATPTEAAKLPFIDDFSNYMGFPKSTHWQDKSAFVNQGYAIAPPTMGVVTLDALDQNGKIYQHANSTSFAADTLTSRPIRLDSIFTTPRKIKIQDSIYLSFYFQPGGAATYQTSSPQGFHEWERVGDEPETDDSLVLEFGYETGDTIFTGFGYSYYVLENDYAAGDTLWNPFMIGDYYVFSEYRRLGDSIMLPSDSLFGPEMVWNHIWSTPGFSVDSEYEKTKHYFRQVMIPITDPQYLRNNFQFRFRNYASLEGNGITGWASNVDQWHIDYVYLNINRTRGDIYPNDVAFVAPANSILEKYESMPWNQFRQTDLRSSFSNTLSNLSNTTKNTNYSYSVMKNGKTKIGEYESNNENATPFYINGWHTYAAHATPSLNFTIPTDAADSAEIEVTHIFQVTGLTGDECHANDTCRRVQKFYNYYAYDDGTAEAGYSILSSSSKPQVYLAMRFSLAEPDTLRSVRMWFNHVQNDANVDYFTLMVWSDNGGEPGDVLYSKEGQLPKQANEFLDFVDYYTDPVAVSGTFYVGFLQTHDVQLNIGFDANNDGRDYFLYKTAATWRKPILKGVPMIRPVLGKHFEIAGISEQKLMKLKVYPNPTTSTAEVVLNPNCNLPSELYLYDMQGRLLQTLPVENNFYDEVHIRVDLSNCPSGIYLVKAGYSVAKILKR